MPRRATKPRPRPRKRRRLPETRTKRDAFTRALAALNRRERSTAEIREWLSGKGFDSSEVEDAIERLTAAGALDDSRFAQCFADDKRELAGWGEERIATTLIERGVERELAERVAVEDHEAQVERAARLLAGRGDELGDDAGRNRALGFLTRRGFAYEVAYDAIRELSRGQR